MDSRASEGSGSASRPQPRVAAVIVSFETRELTLAAVESVLSSRGVSTEVWVVDNASRDGSAAAIGERYPGVRRVELDENVGFGRANNVALKAIDAPYVLFLNSDAAFPEDDGLARLVAALAADERCGVIGPRLEHPNGAVWYSMRAFPGVVAELVQTLGLYRLVPRALLDRWLAREFREHDRPNRADWLTGACMLARGEVVRAVGGFDPRIFLYSEDLDWCWRVRKGGWEIAFEPSVVVVHHGGASGQAPLEWRGRVGMSGEAYVIRKHRGILYLGVFALARTTCLALRFVCLGLLAAATGSDLRARRCRETGAALRAWLIALGSGPSPLGHDEQARDRAAKTWSGRTADHGVAEDGPDRAG